jgi:hypothetical protein
MTLIQKPTRIAHALVLGVALTPLFSSASARAAGPNSATGSADPADGNTRVRSLFRQASVASQDGKYEEARRLLLDAWSIRQTYDVASSLAQVEIQLKRYRDAAEHLEFCLRNFAPVESEQTLDQAKRAYAEVKTRVASVKISANRKGAEIFVDGLRVGTDPLPSVIFVEPGRRTLAARIEGDTAEESLTAVAGKEYVAELELNGRGATATARSGNATDAPIKPPALAHQPNYAPAVVTASVGGAALVSGVVLLLQSMHKDSQRDDRLDKLPGSNQCGVQSPNGSECDEIRSLANDTRTFRALSFVGFGAAAAAGVATYFLWPRSHTDAQLGHRGSRVGHTGSQFGHTGSELGVRAIALPSPAGVDIFTGISGTF